MTPATDSGWRTHDDSPQIAVDGTDRELAAAIGRARDTSGEARERWNAADQIDRRRWAVKWAAPTTAGGVEHVWVVPLTWTRFRIEGRLASPPQGELECGRREGEFVGFAAADLSDWIHLLDDEVRGRREGGFTVDVLEARHGRPPLLLSPGDGAAGRPPP